MSDVDKWIEIAKRCKYLPEDDLRELCNIVCDLLLEEPNVQPVQTPVTVCGDIHGQFYDLEELFHIGGQVPHTKYIFMGDYVDRGYYSLETLTLLMALKARYPDRAHQLVNEGFKYMFDKRLVTVWSAPNYCYRCGNVASILEFNTVNDRVPKLFQAVPDSEREVPPQHTTPYFL
ncbi:hypothetical protein HF086_012540 [Spodoptera exigua]|uniref:protein-serine/threonine phosphatase n=1 Tax=Spodoptera exigua TaxID=7107 RepID=A0A922ST03_SPOEX|nr:hypothetical protein HF086_012540 [Spodoptera exigua]